MKSVKLWALIVLLPFLLWNCAKDDDNSSSTTPRISNKILPLGASRIAGDRPNHESFRYELWKLLNNSNYRFDFIGSVEDQSTYPTSDNSTFDRDHEGHSGYTSAQILSNIESWLKESGTPDIVLFSSPGGNDALQGLNYDDIIDNINQTVDILQDKNPNVVILIEQTAPAKSSAMTPQLTDYFNRIQLDIEDLASDQTTETSSVIAIDLATDFSDSYLADDIHYNQAGAEFVANRYFPILTSVMNK